MGGGGKGSSCSTIGYRYYAGLHLIFCHALDALLQVGVGEKVAWEGEVTENTTLQINKPELFGGDNREGGIVGAVDVCFGLPTQAPNSYLQSILGTAIPAFRGLFGLVANHCQLSAMNPYIKPWWIMGKRTATGWHEELAEITAPDGYADMNAVHIIREALVNTTWGGMGYPEADIDDDAFYSAAYIMKEGGTQEGIGLSLLWSKSTTVEDFIGAILQHIDAVLFFSHVTGLLTIKLVRNDYAAALLPVLDDSNITELSEYTGPASTESINQLTVVWVDRDNQARANTVHDIAGLSRAQGQTIPTTMEFPGITNERAALMIAAREMQQLCVPLSSCTLVMNRKNWDLEPGDCFTFNWPPVGIEGMVMRVTSIDLGLHTDGQLRVKAARDVYGLGPVALVEPAESLWTDPISAPAAAALRRLDEITYWQFVRIYGEGSSVLGELDDSSTFLTCFCGRPSSDAINYEMWDKNSGAATYEKKDTDSFPFVGTVAVALDPEVYSSIQLQENFIDTNLVKVGMYADLDGELVSVTSIDTVNVVVGVKRGILDTVPVAHPIGTPIWFHQDLFGLDQTERADGEQVDVKMLPSTSQGRLEIDSAPVDTKTLEGRMMRPYAPGNVQVGGERWPSTIGEMDDLVLTWSHRDRTLQTVSFVGQDETDIGPEAGVTYTLRIYGETNDLLRTITGITDNFYTYLNGTEIADSSIPEGGFYHVHPTITNPGAESGTTGWTNEAGGIAVMAGGHSGSYHFYGGTSGTTIARQRFDLVALGVTADALDGGGVVAKVEWYSNSYSGDADSDAMGLRPLDASSTNLGESYSALYNDSTWTLRSHEITLPTGTRYLDALMKMVRSGGTNNDGYIDDIFITLIVPTAYRLNTSLRFELEAVRGSLVSFNKWDLTVTRS